ncbi:MAG: peroxide stress protein YaaA [Candidatus Heimdallarchaeota archaeon]|nr:MAG: peroxide stress protein YaaA [Candidatus Heimdallarchaeota archaeon]
MKHPKILLIISCGKKKALGLQDRKMRASEAYTGPMYQVIQKAKREGRWSSSLHLGIVSAKYGFLREDEFIEHYDLKMTDRLAEKLNPQVSEKILKWHNELSFDLIYILMGKTYLKSVQGLDAKVDTKLVVENMGGLGLGQRKLITFLERYSEKAKPLTDFVK